MPELVRSDRPNLYILTLSFPFSSAAEGNFLRPEIEVLKEFFQITIVPRRTQGEQEELPEGCILDLDLAAQLTAGTPRGLQKMFRLIHPSVFMEIIRSLPKSLNPRYLIRIASDYLLGQYALDWIKLRKLEPTSKSALIYGWWLTPEVLSLASHFRPRCFPIVSRAHGGDLYDYREDPPGKPFRSQAISHLDGIFPDSIAGVDYLCRKYPLVSPVTRVSTLGTEDFGVSRIINRDSQTFRIVSCSFINPIKQLWVAIGGISQFANSNSDLNVDWVHFGDGDLNAIVNSESKLPENLVITQRPYPGIQELRRYYLNTEINVFVNTSKSEGVPVALMEAASCGIPLIGPGIGGVPDIVRDGFNGFIMSPHATTNTLSDCIQKLFDLEFHSRSEFHRNSRQVWEQAFDARVTYLKFAKDLIDLQRLKGSAC